MGTDTRENEATTGVGKVSWRDFEFEVPLERDEWSVDFLESIEEAKAVGVVRGALGPKQWHVVRGLNLKVRDLNELAAEISKAMGFGSAGESQTSSD